MKPLHTQNFEITFAFAFLPVGKKGGNFKILCETKLKSFMNQENKIFNLVSYFKERSFIFVSDFSRKKIIVILKETGEYSLDNI